MQIVTFPDPVLRCQQYLKGHITEPLSTELPDGYTGTESRVRVVDAGGPGRREWAYTDRRLVLEVWGPRRSEAFKLAQKIAGLLQQWPQQDTGVYLRDPERDVGDPQWLLTETRIPRYVLTATLAFRGDEAAPIPA